MTARVLCLIDTREINGPCRGLFQLAESAEMTGVELVLGMFLIGAESSSEAIEEARRRGYRTQLLHQKGRVDPRPILDALTFIRPSGIRILQSHSYKPAFLALLLKMATGLPWVAFAHGHTSQDFKMGLYNRLDRWLLRRADRVIAVSDATRAWLVRSGVEERRIRVVRNAIDPKDHRLETDGSDLRRKYGMGSSDRVVAVVGRLSAEKGQGIFIEALRAVSARVSNVHGWIVGSGPEDQRLRNAVKDAGLSERARFLGHVREMSAVYAASDLVVIPSLSEGLPNVALEAMLHGKPLVATRVGGVPEALGPELARCLVAPGDPAALAEAMIRMLQDPDSRARLGALGARAVRERFLPQARARQVAGVYEELLETAGSSRRFRKSRTGWLTAQRQ